MKFKAEVIEVRAKKLASLDKEFKVILVTNDPIVLGLQEHISENIIEIEVKE